MICTVVMPVTGVGIMPLPICKHFRGESAPPQLRHWTNK